MKWTALLPLPFCIKWSGLTECDEAKLNLVHFHNGLESAEQGPVNIVLYPLQEACETLSKSGGNNAGSIWKLLQRRPSSPELGIWPHGDREQKRWSPG